MFLPAADSDTVSAFASAHCVFVTRDHASRDSIGSHRRIVANTRVVELIQNDIVVATVMTDARGRRSIAGEADLGRRLVVSSPGFRTVEVSFQNLLSEHYNEAFGYPALAFMFRVGLKFTLGGELWLGK